MKKPQTPDEIERIQQAILEREVEEELQKERLLNFWNKYRFLIIGGVIGIILTVAGTEIYHSWHNKVRLAESNIFEKAAVLNAKGEKEAALQELTALEDTYTDYKYLAELKKASIFLADNKKTEALQVLKGVMDNKSAPEALRNTALLSYVGNQVDTGNPDELLTLLTPLLNQNSAYFTVATELKTALLLKQDKKEEASKTLKEALLNPNLTPNATTRINTLLSGM